MKIDIEPISKEYLPEVQHKGEDAGLDLKSREDATLYPGDRKMFKTGTKLAIPGGYYGSVNPRSGLAKKHGITVLNADGVVDPGYRGEIGVILINHSDTDFKINKGDRIAQLIIQKYEDVEFNVVDSLDETKRGDSGFGDSGR